MTAEKISQKTFLLFLLLLILLVLCTASCNTTEPPDDKAVLTLTLEDVSCTEAWITLTKNNLQLPAEINLTRTDVGGNSNDEKLFVSTADTLLYIDSLLPNQTYKFQSVIQPFNQSSNEISVTTMDTTSHDITFETWTFGDIGSSSLYDVAIISENNIWAVGEILIADTSENGYTQYCYLKWDGIQWELGILKYFPLGSVGDSITTRGTSIFAFNENDVWISGGAVFHWNGSYWKTFYNTGAEGANKIWGTSSSDLYFVGRNGSIAHYNGSPSTDGWTKIESGTSLPIRDIWGDYNTKTNKYEILAVAAEVDINIGSKVLRIEGNSVTEESNNGLSWQVGGLWFKSGSKYYVAGAGIHYKHNLNDYTWNRYLQGVVTNYVGFGIGGNKINDVFATGSFLEIAHFNGVTWHNYLDEISSSIGALGKPFVKGNLMVAPGLDGSSALVVIGRRN